MEYRTLSYERDGHVAVLTYDRPEQRNAVSRADERASSTTHGSASATTTMRSCS